MAFLAVGSTLFWSVDGSAWTELVELVSIGSPDPGTPPDVDVTPVNTSAKVRAFLAGLGGGGDFDFEQLMDKKTARYSVLDAKRLQVLWWKVQLADGTTASSGSTFKWQGALKKWALVALDDPDKRVTAVGQCKVSGDVEHTEGT